MFIIYIQMEQIRIELGYQRLLDSKIEIQIKENMTKCWETSLSKSSTGYGQITINGKPWNTHRFSYFINHNQEPLLDNHHICHKCDNKKCFNPDHLYQGTRKENAKDAQERNINLISRKKPKKIHKRDYVNEMSDTFKECQYEKGDMKGENNTTAKLTEIQVKEILQKYKDGLKYGELKKMADHCKIKYITIQKIVAGKLWSHLN